MDDNLVSGVRKGRRPYLAWRSEEPIEKRGSTNDGKYEDSTDMLMLNGKPIASVDELALETMTFTKAPGESSDRD